MSLQNHQIAIVHGASPNFGELKDITFTNHADYALQYGYDLRTFQFQASETVWGKIRALQETFADPHIRRAFWIDADAVFTNLNLSLTEHLPHGKVVVSCDIFGINTGCLWLENCTEVCRLLWAIATEGHQLFAKAIWPEQCALRHFSLHPPYAELFTYVEQTLMNSYLNEHYSEKYCADIGRPEDGFGQWQPGDFILHLPAISHHKRIEILKKILPLYSKIPIA